MSDEQVIERVLRGETALYAVLILRYHARLRSAIYPILHNDAEVEDAIQEGHARALAHLRQFAGRSSFITWMTRIIIHEALGILRRRRRVLQFDELSDARSGRPMTLPARGRSPEQQAIDAELRQSLAQALHLLPETYRTVFMLREIDEISTTDAAGILGISEECVRIRLHRARLLLRQRLSRSHRARTKVDGSANRARPRRRTALTLCKQA
jgi:RNA polymerase sigma-70 factor, ECF subfamily